MWNYFFAEKGIHWNACFYLSLGNSLYLIDMGKGSFSTRRNLKNNNNINEFITKKLSQNKNRITVAV